MADQPPLIVGQDANPDSTLNEVNDPVSLDFFQKTAVAQVPARYPDRVLNGTFHTLSVKLPMADSGLALYNRAMETLGHLDRAGHRDVFFATPQHPCWEPLRVDARKHREARSLDEIIPAAISDYQRRRAKTRKPLRFKTRDSMPLVLNEQVATAKAQLKKLGIRPESDIRVVNGGRAIRFAVPCDVEPRESTKPFDIAIVAGADGLSFACEDQSGHTTVARATLGAVKSPSFIPQLVHVLGRSARSVVVHAAKDLNGVVAEVLRQVTRRVQRRAAEHAIAVKRVGAVDRTTPLCPLCHCAVPSKRTHCTACGEDLTTGVLDAYAVLAQGKDSMGSIAFLQQGYSGRTTHRDILDEDAPFVATGDDDNNENDLADVLLLPLQGPPSEGHGSRAPKPRTVPPETDPRPPVEASLNLSGGDAMRPTTQQTDPARPETNLRPPVEALFNLSGGGSMRPATHQQVQQETPLRPSAETTLMHISPAPPPTTAPPPAPPSTTAPPPAPPSTTAPPPTIELIDDEPDLDSTQTPTRGRMTWAQRLIANAALYEIPDVIDETPEPINPTQADGLTQHAAAPLIPDVIDEDTAPHQGRGWRSTPVIDAPTGASARVAARRHADSSDSPETREAAANHPMCRPWWERLGLLCAPEVYNVSIMEQLIIRKAKEEADFYLKGQRFHLLPPSLGISTYSDTTHNALMSYIMTDIEHEVETYYPASRRPRFSPWGGCQD